MPDVLLFGATGYTGSLTAHALARRGTSFAIAGRDLAKLERLASETGGPPTHVVSVGDTDALVTALDDAGVLITCVGPFMELGATAVDAVLRAGVHYVDSSGEIDFISGLVERRMDSARAAGIVMVPAAGFDEVPADVALSLALDGMSDAHAVLTYALPSSGSAGTIRTVLSGIVHSRGRWIRAGEPIEVGLGERSRWSPMPPPLGPKFALSYPLAEGCLAPLHLDLRSLELYSTSGRAQATALRTGLPLARIVLRSGVVRSGIERALTRGAAGPDPTTRARDRWTILAEARSDAGWRNVAVMGADPYGLTAETLALVAMKLAHEGHEEAGVMSPVQAVGVETLQKALIDFGVDFQMWEGA